MSVGDYCTRNVTVAGVDDSIAAAAHLMRQHHVGDVIVARAQAGRRFPLGIVTDRDLVVEVLDAGIDPETVRLGDLITEPLLSAREDEALADAVRRMRARGVRRIPVVDDDGALVGILSMDDVIELIAEEMQDLSGLVARERSREARRRR